MCKAGLAQIFASAQNLPALHKNSLRIHRYGLGCGSGAATFPSCCPTIYGPGSSIPGPMCSRARFWVRSICALPGRSVTAHYYTVPPFTGRGSNCQRHSGPR